jgi:hypothetical protein
MNAACGSASITWLPGAVRVDDMGSEVVFNRFRDLYLQVGRLQRELEDALDGADRGGPARRSYLLDAATITDELAEARCRAEAYGREIIRRLLDRASMDQARLGMR